MNHANVVLDQPHLIDTLRFRVQVEKSLQQETVRIGVLVIVRGYERVQLQAVTRVSAAENHHLKECRFPFARRCSSADEFEPNCAIASAR